jgi:hypothetical protein
MKPKVDLLKILKLITLYLDEHKRRKNPNYQYEK